MGLAYFIDWKIGVIEVGGKPELRAESAFSVSWESRDKTNAL